MHVFILYTILFFQTKWTKINFQNVFLDCVLALVGLVSVRKLEHLVHGAFYFPPPHSQLLFGRLKSSLLKRGVDLNV